MIYSVNKATLIGHISSDAIEKEASNGTHMTTFNVTTGDVSKNKSGEKISRKERHNVIMWGKMADVYAKNIKKGRLVYIEGKIQTRNFEDSNGKKNFYTEIVCKDFKFLSTKEYDDNRDAEYSNDNADNLYEDDDYTSEN